MENELLTLKLFLDAVGVGTSIDGVDQRKLIQKAIYLGQCKALDLGYRFSWYKMGPYSPSLTEDYYKLDSAKINTGFRLRTDIAQNLRQVAAMLNQVPSSLDKPSWAELLCSYHYLRKVSAYDENRADIALKESKPKLIGHLDLAKEKLTELQLL